MAELFWNAGKYKLASPVSASQTTLELESYEQIPAGIGPNTFRLVLEDKDGIEVVVVREVTVSSGAITGLARVLRAQEGTSARDWVVGTTVGNRWTAALARAALAPPDQMNNPYGSGLVPSQFAVHASNAYYGEKPGTETIDCNNLPNGFAGCVSAAYALSAPEDVSAQFWISQQKVDNFNNCVQTIYSIDDRNQIIPTRVWRRTGVIGGSSESWTSWAEFSNKGELLTVTDANNIKGSGAFYFTGSLLQATSANFPAISGAPTDTLRIVVAQNLAPFSAGVQEAIVFSQNWNADITRKFVRNRRSSGWSKWKEVDVGILELNKRHIYRSSTNMEVPDHLKNTAFSMYAIVIGGGGGGGSTGTTAGFKSGGGGAGGKWEGYIHFPAGTTVISITVGAGGSAGDTVTTTIGNAGKDGGFTSVQGKTSSGSITAIVTAGGGGGGGAGAPLSNPLLNGRRGAAYDASGLGGGDGSSRSTHFAGSGGSVSRMTTKALSATGLGAAIGEATYTAPTDYAETPEYEIVVPKLNNGDTLKYTSGAGGQDFGTGYPESKISSRYIGAGGDGAANGANKVAVAGSRKGGDGVVGGVILFFSNPG
ncbi:hypothetical protein E8K88_11975 [Lampropedia aestuarii]|uniref:Glycine-rich domain-containing protein n=1 Tax=Lampropedia aestuarii TaxID=2562762 RepID=A0A4S5BNG4_9BURK|nr:pyocin knob domain-containing protein [Lampropedia aestuarii]THJ32411.1 hypothetical protein E8K88_11975 [Lampropedia aestuarii]